MKNNYNKKVIALILAGGKSRRMNGNDKSLITINKENLLDICFKRISKQVDKVIINTNNEELISSCNKRIFIEDYYSGFLGPLSGVLTGMKWIKINSPKINWLLTVPVDSPFFPEDLLRSFFSGINNELIVSAVSGEKKHPVFSIWNLSLIDVLEMHVKKGILKIDEFTKKFKTKVVKFPIIDYDPFYNINHSKDLSEAKIIYDKYFLENLEGTKL